MEDGIVRFIAAVEPHDSSVGDTVARLRRMIAAHVEVVADNPERSQVVFHQWRFLGADNLPHAVARRRQYEDHYISAIGEGIASGVFKPDLNLRITVLTILGALNWTPEWFSPEGRMSALEVGSLMADAMLGGILA